MYPSITKPEFFISTVKHNVKHHIVTKGQPIHCKARQLDPKRLEIVKR